MNRLTGRIIFRGCSVLIIFICLFYIKTFIRLTTDSVLKIKNKQHTSIVQSVSASNLINNNIQQSVPTATHDIVLTEDVSSNVIKSSSQSVPWTLLLTVNDAFFDFFANWFSYYTKLKLHLPIVILVQDVDAYRKLETLCTYCQLIKSYRNLHKALEFNTADFIKLMSQRPATILRLLRDGKNVLHVDIDSVWLHDPLPFINTSVDITYQLDTSVKVCVGFLAIKSNNKTIDLVMKWRDRMSKKPKVNDQATFNAILQENKSIKHQALDILYFPNGRQYFSQFNKTQKSHVVIVHNNYIVGHDKKKRRFQNHGLWMMV